MDSGLAAVAAIRNDEFVGWESGYLRCAREMLFGHVQFVIVRRQNQSCLGPFRWPFLPVTMPGEQERVRMRRRAFIAILGSALLGGTAIAWRSLSSFWRARFDEHAAQTVTAITNLMFPGDELPAATELGIHNRVLAMAELRDTMADGVDWLDQGAKSQGAANFLALDESARSAAIEAAFASSDDAAKQFVILLRYYAGLNYYSHPTIKAAFPYTDPPQPEGFTDFQDPPR
jgi:hypothetical protein